MKLVSCKTCGKPFEVPGDVAGGRETCPSCDARAADRPRLRRCLKCHANQFARPGRCLYCTAATVGIALPEAVAEDDGAPTAYQKDYETYRRYRLLATRGIWGATALLLALILVETMRNRYWVLNVVFFLAFSAMVVTVALWLQKRAVEKVDAWFARRHPGPPPDEERAAARRAKKLEHLKHEVIDPFLDRNGIVEGATARVPDGELLLLKQVLSKHDLDLDADRLQALLIACALRRDLDPFRARVEQAEAVGVPLLSSYAALAPEEKDDRKMLPLLRHVLAERGREVSDDNLTSAVGQARHEHRLRGFEKDLRERRG